jgi:endonuclease YncB( thermonuclease family)
MVPHGHGFSLNFGHMGQSGVAQRLRCFVAAPSFGVLLALVLALPVSAETFDGRLAIIIDGDTLAIGTERVRLLNIDAPESSRCEHELVMGLKAKERLAALVRSGPLEIVRHGQDRYRRTLARVYVGGQDLGQVLIQEGLALPWRDGSDARADRLQHWCG